MRNTRLRVSCMHGTGDSKVGLQLCTLSFSRYHVVGASRQDHTGGGHHLPGRFNSRGPVCNLRDWLPI